MPAGVRIAILGVLGVLVMPLGAPSRSRRRRPPPSFPVLWLSSTSGMPRSSPAAANPRAP